MAVNYIGERIGRYDRFERNTRKNVNRWITPQPVKRRVNRWYEEQPHENAYWPCVVAFTVATFIILFWIWWIVG